MSKDKRKDYFIKEEFLKSIRNLIIFSCVLAAIGGVLIWCSFQLGFKTAGVVRILSGVVFAMSGITLIYGIATEIKKKNELLKYIEDFAFATENATKAAILGFPDPLAVVTADGLIKWYNTEFVQLCGRGNLFDQNIRDIFPAIRLSGMAGQNGLKQSFSYNGRDFIISGVLSDSSGGASLIGISFTDISEITTLQKQIDEEKSVVCTAIIDNYDEVLKETPTSEHGALISDIERCIGEWVERGKGIYRRYERDKFIIVFEAVNFEKLISEKFSVLDEAKEINQQNRIPVTLSIGVGMAAGTVKENDLLSLAALDMALGRGGDQAVMKTEDGYTFFGAKSLGVEKTTKVKARVVAGSLGGLVESMKRIIIMGHKGADYDSFGASIGLFRVIMDIGQNAYIALNRTQNNVNEILQDFLVRDEYAERIITVERAMSLVDDETLVIIVDTHRPNMTEYPELLNRAGKVVLIDHHRRSEDFIQNAALVYHEPYASSTCEMVTELLQYINGYRGLSVEEAEALYCGIYMDTKGFTFKTGARTFEAAAYLRKIGVDPVGVHKLFRNDLAMYIQKSNIISKVKVYREKIAIAVCEELSKNVQLVVAQAADDLLNINGIEASFVLADIGNKIIISGRSLGAVNVQVILEKLGGGGHITIAGAQLENSRLSIAELKLHNAIDEILFE